jgi:hypothetical protein
MLPYAGASADVCCRMGALASGRRETEGIGEIRRLQCGGEL